MNKSCLAILSSLAFGAAIVNAPQAWAQATPGSSSEKSGSESRAQKPTDPPVSTSQQPGTSSKSEMSRSEGTGMQGSKESRGAGKWSKDKVKAVQEALKTKGFDPGEPDGVLGPKTGRALRDFQKSQNIQVTGRIDDKTASALGVDAGAASKESTIGSRAKSETSGTSPSGASGTGSQSSMQKEPKEKTAGDVSESTKGDSPARPSSPAKPEGQSRKERQ